MLATVKSVATEFGRQHQENREFQEASLGYRRASLVYRRPHLKNKRVSKH